MIGGLERQQAAQQNWRRVGCVKQWAENFYRRVAARPLSDLADVGGFAQLGGRSIDLGWNQSDLTARTPGGWTTDWSAELQAARGTSDGAVLDGSGTVVSQEFDWYMNQLEEKDWEKENRGRQSDERWQKQWRRRKIAGKVRKEAKSWQRSRRKGPERGQKLTTKPSEKSGKRPKVDNEATEKVWKEKKNRISGWFKTYALIPCWNKYMK
jgi:hypothetical protein